MQSNFLARRVGAEASHDRLERLIRRRLEPDANKAEIDAQIWDTFGEERAILFPDLSGFSRHVAEFGIIHFLQTILESERILVPLIEQHGGLLLKVEGDSMLIIFRTVTRALQCAIDMQHATVTYNRDRDDSEKVLLCAGLGFGKVLRIGDTDVFGSEVNAASKLGEDTATSGELLITEAVRVAIEECGVDTVTFEKMDTIPSGAKGAYRVPYQQ